MTPKAAAKLAREAAKGTFDPAAQSLNDDWAGVEAILALRALWISQDGRWEKYWKSRTGYQKTA